MDRKRMMMVSGGRKPLGDLPVGPYTNPTIVYMDESGIRTPFIVLQHGYEDNPNATLLLRKDCYPVDIAWDKYNANSYYSSDAQEWCDETYAELIAVRTHMRFVTVRYVYSGMRATKEADEFVCFLLSARELGLTDSSVPEDDSTPIPFFSCDAARIAYKSGYAVAKWWTRSPELGDIKPVITPTAAGAYGTANAVKTAGTRPAFCLDSACLVDADGTIDGSI